MFIQTLLNTTGLSPFGGSMLCPVNVSLHTMQTKHGIQCSGVSTKCRQSASVRTTKAARLEDGCSPESVCCYSHHLH